jgi:tetraacyldisaccharide 4'-kinase
MKKTKLRDKYLDFIERNPRNIFEAIIAFILFLLSLIYGLIVSLKNILYQYQILKSVSPRALVVNVGNISWGGTGKTTLVRQLAKYLQGNYKVATVTKSYAPDEFNLLRQELEDVFDAKDRLNLIKNQQDNFDLFLLDDSFQYRKIKKDLNIIVMRAQELEHKYRLIPAYIFREPISSLRRADMLVINYCHQLSQPEIVKQKLLGINKDLKIYFARYVFQDLTDLNHNPRNLADFSDKKVGVLTAIGYPQGLVDTIKEAGVIPEKVISYPDHYQFSSDDIARVEQEFMDSGVKHIFISYKDFYHMNLSSHQLNYFIFQVQLNINQQQRFWRDLNNLLKK